MAWRDVNVGSLFSGIGGFDLGLERAGMRVVWQCEQDDYRRRVLARHWPGIPCYPDVCALVADTGRGTVQRDGGSRSVAGSPGGVEGEGDQRERDGDTAGDGGAFADLPVSVPYVDVLCGGFPCQDLSYAGKGAGIDGSRSGLWSEYARLVRELRPRYVIVENVPALLGRGLGRVLGDLAACGYDAEWDCIPAAAVGAPHRRDRIWLVAYPQRAGLADPQRDGRAAGTSLEATPEFAVSRDGGSGPAGVDWWAVEPSVGRVAHGIPHRVDRLRSLGNALVPQIAEWLGRRILEWEGMR